MYLWPVKHITIETNLNRDDLYEVMGKSVDQDNRSIYWGKKFYKLFWGNISKEAFRIRPVVPYWNISPVEIRGRVEAASDNQTHVSMKMICPYLRIIIPLAALAIVLFFVNYGLKGETAFFFNSTALIVIASYLLTNIPFQIQATRNIQQLVEKFGGKLTRFE